MNLPDHNKVALETVRKSIPGLGEDLPLFLAPWQTRVFALVVALVEQGQFPWAEFQSRLANLITDIEQMELANHADAVEGRYFECWLRAAEETLIAKEFLTMQDVDDKIASLGRLIAGIRQEQQSRS